MSIGNILSEVTQGVSLSIYVHLDDFQVRLPGMRKAPGSLKLPAPCLTHSSEKLSSQWLMFCAGEPPAVFGSEEGGRNSLPADSRVSSCRLKAQSSRAGLVISSG